MLNAVEFMNAGVNYICAITCRSMCASTTLCTMRREAKKGMAHAAKVMAVVAVDALGDSQLIAVPRETQATKPKPRPTSARRRLMWNRRSRRDTLRLGAGMVASRSGGQPLQSNAERTGGVALI